MIAKAEQSRSFLSRRIEAEMRIEGCDCAPCLALGVPRAKRQDVNTVIPFPSSDLFPSPFQYLILSRLLFFFLLISMQFVPRVWTISIDATGGQVLQDIGRVKAEPDFRCLEGSSLN